ncbi:MAG: tspO [Labilithrix sp.]|nr:tspO [Labilithrix sp.]
MQIDKPEADEPVQPSNIHDVTGTGPLPPEPPQALFGQEKRRRVRIAPRGILGTLLIGGATVAAALLGRAATTRTAMVWYRALKKPAWTPPEQTFSLVWPVLYTLSAVSAWRVWRAPPSRDRTITLGFWGAQIATNGIWTRLFFGEKKPRLALMDLGANLGSAASYALAASRVDRTAGLLMAPYVAWVAFAGTINASVARHNTWSRLLFER